MLLQDFIAVSTLENMEKFLAETAKVSAEALDWKPSLTSRSVLSQMQELGVIPAYFPHILRTLEAPAIDETFMARYEVERAELDSYEKAEAAIRLNTLALVDVIRAVPAEDLNKEIPFFGGQMWSVPKLMLHHFTNLEYHTGQVYYINTLFTEKQDERR